MKVLVQFSKVDSCPFCYKKLCKRRTIEGAVLIEFKHKGAMLYFENAIIRCSQCNRFFQISADAGIVREVNFGTKK